MLDFSSRYNVLLIEQEVFSWKETDIANRAKKLPSGVLPQKNGSPPPRLLQKLFQLLSSWGQSQLETLPHMLPSAKQEEIMVILFLIASSSTAIYPITPLLVFQAVYGRGKHLQRVNMRALLIIQPPKPYFIMEGLQSAGVSNSLSVIVPP